MAHVAIATNLITDQSVAATGTWTSNAITLAPNSIAAQVWIHNTISMAGTPTSNQAIKTKVCPVVVATVFDDGPDIPFLVTATGTYNMSIMVPQLAQISKIVVTNDTFQTLTLSCDIEYVEVT